MPSGCRRVVAALSSDATGCAVREARDVGGAVADQQALGDGLVAVEAPDRVVAADPGAGRSAARPSVDAGAGRLFREWQAPAMRHRRMRSRCRGSRAPRRRAATLPSSPPAAANPASARRRPCAIARLQLVDPLLLVADDRDHRHAELACELLRRHLMPAPLGDVHHVQRDDQRPAQLDRAG